MKAIRYYLLLPILFSFILGNAQKVDDGPYHDYDTFQLQNKMIIGKFLNEDKNWELEFTKDGKCHERFVITTDSTPCEYSYSITFSTREDSDVPAGYYNVYTLHLKALFPSESCEDTTYEMYVNDKVLDLYPIDKYGAFLFYRVKPKESASSKPPSKEEGSISKEKPKEEEKESELLPRWELVKSSDYDKGYLDGGSAYEQCKKEQGKEREFLDGDKRMPMEKMGWETVEYQAEFQECKKRFFDGIKRENESYQEGFEEGWRDASMPLNKEKETTKKK